MVAVHYSLVYQRLKINKKIYIYVYVILEGTARYAGLILAPAEGFGLRPRPIWP